MLRWLHRVTTLKLILKTEFPMPIKPGERFALREGGKTVAAGVITEILPDTAEDLKGRRR